jgi:hypothetical protein
MGKICSGTDVISISVYFAVLKMLPHNLRHVNRVQPRAHQSIYTLKQRSSHLDEDPPLHMRR